MIWLLPLGMLLLGLSLSAFFSGSETGFYRASRVRLLLDALGGDRVSRGLLWLSNNPALFVATTLVGNNVANYIVSLAIVLLAQLVFSQGHAAADLIGPVVFTPALFVYGELLPKYLFFHAPNRLLRRFGPLFLLFLVLFSPVAGLLWALGRLIQMLLGESPEHVQLVLARKELEDVLAQSHEAGLLRPAQHRLAQNLFAVGSKPVVDFCTPLARIATVRKGTPSGEVLRLARHQRLPAVPVTEAKSRELIGYVRVIDLRLSNLGQVEQVRPLLSIPAAETHIGALLTMQTKRETLAKVVDAQGKTLGLVHVQQLNEPLFG
jgi:CBS domain containing-hemolysin-like protein